MGIRARFVVPRQGKNNNDAGLCLRTVWIVVAAAMLFFGGYALAVTRPSAAPRTVEKSAQPPAPEQQAPQPPARSALSSSMDVSADPATVSLKNGELTVGAHNSDLAEILKNIARLSGMQIDGLARSSRVFGAYGPGKPQDVLAELLNGSGYNFMMVGQSSEGAPLRLLLTEKTGAPPTPSSAQPPAPQKTASEEPLPGRARYGWAGGQGAPPHSPSTPTESPSQAPPPDLGPGAIYPQPPAENADRQERVQQMMNRIRAIHQQQQNQMNGNQQ